jgi:virulence factor Mce-like protein
VTRRPGQLGTHRVIMGTVALFLILFAVFVAFKSTRGIPFIPRYNLTVQVPTAGKLTAGADVMIAGTRVGTVTDVQPAVAADGKPVANMSLAIEKKYQPIPADSTFSVHLIGALGHKFIDIQPGTSSRDLADGAFVPIADNANSAPVTDIDQVLNTFTESARTGTRTTFEALGLGFAGRGTDVNGFLQHFPDTLTQSAKAQKILGAPSTNLAGFVSGLNSFFAELAPTSPVLPQMTTDLNSTFGAFNSSRAELQAAISKSPDLLGTLTRTFPREARVISATADLMHKLQPGAAVLPDTAPQLAAALSAGARNLGDVPTLSQRLASGITYFADYSQLPQVLQGSQRLGDLANSLLPPVDFLTPAETTCHYFSLVLRNLWSLSKEDVGTGTPFRAQVEVTDTTRNSERGPSSGIWTASAAKAIGPVHANPYPNTAAPGETHECESGNEPYIQNRPIIGNVPGQQKDTTEDPVAAP